MKDSDRNQINGNARLSAIVHGRVQGVYFRGFVQEHSRIWSIVGYARNLPNGASVEVQAEGDRAALEQLLRLLHQGPPESIVRDVESTWGAPTGQFEDFETL